jgi:hypothetical protein
MMNDPKFAPFGPFDPVDPSGPVDPEQPVAETPAEPAPEVRTDAAPAPPVVSPAVQKFKSCRWRCTPEDGEFCTHRDVLPFAGKEGFVAESWCPDCAFYKLRRTPKKRERLDFTY